MGKIQWGNVLKSGGVRLLGSAAAGAASVGAEKITPAGWDPNIGRGIQAAVGLIGPEMVPDKHKLLKKGVESFGDGLVAIAAKEWTNMAIAGVGGTPSVGADDQEYIVDGDSSVEGTAKSSAGTY